MPNMASRRSYRNLKQNINQDYTVLKLNDVLCPICRSILIEPVTLPCNHGFCLSCFKGTVENANLVCPLCRIRIGSWLRKSKKDSNLINVPLWEAINNNYSQHVKNKLDGLDEHLEDEPRVIVSLPGEIRKEYEIQKQKEDEEIRLIREAENRASEELIKKLKEEEEYQQTVMEEKIRLDEEMAKKIAAELSYMGPSTSNSKLVFTNSSKTVGPMDRFLKKDNETVTSQSITDQKPAKKFAEKEYTCRVLYLDRKKDNNVVPQTFSPIIKKKIQQIQKNCENDQLNDSFECFEADMRYFKPIDNKCCAQINGKPPIKVPCRKAHKNGAAKILSPSGMINFRSNCLESAFARISLALPNTQFFTTTDSNFQEKHERKEPLAFCINLKRKLSTDDLLVSHKTFIRGPVSPTLNNQEKLKVTKITYNKKHRFPEKRNITMTLRESPPFYGFDNSSKKDTKDTLEKDIQNNVCNDTNDVKNNREETKKNDNNIQQKKNDKDIAIRRNGTLWIEDESYEQKLLQEQADLELAKKLQKEFDQYAHYTRSTRKVGRGSIHRQTTLDQILTGSYRVK